MLDVAKQVEHRRDAHTCMLATRLLLFLPAPLLELPPRSEASPPLEPTAAAATDDDGAAAPNDVDETTAPSSATTSMRWVPSDAWMRRNTAGVCGKGAGWQNQRSSRARGGWAVDRHSSVDIIDVNSDDRISVRE